MKQDLNFLFQFSRNCQSKAFFLRSIPIGANIDREKPRTGHPGPCAVKPHHESLRTSEGCRAKALMILLERSFLTCGRMFDWFPDKKLKLFSGMTMVVGKCHRSMLMAISINYKITETNGLGVFPPFPISGRLPGFFIPALFQPEFHFHAASLV